MDQAMKSGMRGMSKPAESSEAYEESPGEETDQEEVHSPAEIMADHIHGPDENGDHHLNLTSFANAMKSGKKKGLQDK